MTIATATRYVYDFAEGSRDMRALLGGMGANIAEMTGTTLHTVSRLLSAWEKDGIVESTRKHIVVTEPHKLVLLSGTV